MSIKLNQEKLKAFSAITFQYLILNAFLKQRKSILATNHKQQNTLLLPQQPDYLKITPQTSISEEEIIIG